ncbi:HAD-IC family P-type ATPase, partial [Stomatohabitans albus]
MSDILPSPINLEQPWALSSQDALSQLETSEEGLTREHAESRLAAYGRNELPSPEATPWWRRLLDQFDDILVYILMGAAVLKAINSEWVDFTVIAVVVIATAVIGVIQEGRAASALSSLKQMQSLDAQVRRDGAWVLVDAATLVPGDLVRIRAGDRVPADLRLLRGTNMRLDEAALTGESEPSEKSPEPVSREAGVGDRASMLFSGTILTAGEGVGVVVATGMHTEIGKISTLVADQETIATPLNRQLAHLGKQLSILIGVLTVAMVLVGRLIHDAPTEELLEAAIGFAVAAVPEGLPALVTITLALGVQQMAKRNAITRKMESVETLGAVTTICSDKTGTLTQNEMTARVVITTEGTYRVEGTGYDPEGRVVAPDGSNAALADHRGLAELVIAGGVSNDAGIEQTAVGWRVVGQPTEGALDVLATKAGVNIDRVTRVAHVPFESTHKFSATLDDVPTATGTERVVHAAGAPDRLLDRSTYQRSPEGKRVPLDRAMWEEQLETLTDQGLRVLAAASLPGEGLTDLTHSDLDEGLTFLGLVGIVDPPRPEVMEAIDRAHQAGIRVKMITGDHKGTATAIARELKIAPQEGPVEALTGADIERMKQDELCQVVRDVDIYARTSPEHKLRIVRALQSHDEVVAMTGDGVNDAPSITRANVGVAMGIKGTEATKEAADIVLADDNFATIERAVEEGRRIYDNIRKSVVFLLPSNGAQSLVILSAIVFGYTLPLTPLQILWVNLVNAITLSLALATEPAEPGIMNRPPRPKDEQILNRSSLWLVLLASLLIGAAALAS